MSDTETQVPEVVTDGKAEAKNPCPFPVGKGSRGPRYASKEWYLRKLCEIVDKPNVPLNEQMRALSLVAKMKNNYRPVKKTPKVKTAKTTPEPVVVSPGLTERISKYKPNGAEHGHQA